MKLRLIIVLLAVLWGFGAGLLSAAAQPEKGHDLKIEITQGRISADFRDADLRQVLTLLSRKAGFRLTLGEGVAETVSLTIHDASLEEVLKVLCRNRAIAYRYNAGTEGYEIIGTGVFATSPQSASEKDRGAFSEIPVVPDKMRPNQTGTQPSLGGEDGENPRDSQGRLLYQPRELLVQFREGFSKGQIEAFHQSLGSTVISISASSNLYRVRVKEGLSVADVLQSYAASPLVAHVERHALRYPLAAAPTDPSYGSQWGLEKMRLPEAWGLVPDGKQVLIAVIDTGVDYNHPDLAGQMYENRAEDHPNGLGETNSVDDDANQFIDDWRGWDFAGAGMASTTGSDNDPLDEQGHGTHVAGIIAAGINNGVGVAGIAPKARLLALKVQADQTSGSDTMLDSDIIAAFDYARKMGARIVNCSFGGAAASIPEYDAIKALRDAGILVVAAAGNGDQYSVGIKMDTLGSEKTYPAYYGHKRPTIAYPGPLDNVLSVAAGDSNDQLAGFSNYGGSSVDLLAPGVSIYSTCLSGSYCTKQGTSMAAPHVTGLAALLWSKNPTLKYLQVKAAILDNVDKITSLTGKVISGGRVNAFRSVAAVASPGDVNNDGRIDLLDAVLALQVGVAAPVPVGVSVHQEADINGDGRIGLTEALYAFHRIAGIRSVNFPPVLRSIASPTITAGSSVTFIVAARDDDGDPVTLDVSALPVGASFDPFTRIFSWPSITAPVGVYPVTFTVADGQGGTDSLTIHITVTPNQVGLSVSESQ